MELFGATEDIKVHRVFDLQWPQGHRVSKFIARQICKILYQQDMIDFRTRDLSLNKSHVAKHAIVWAINNTIH